jgi:hypothetical protein
MSTSVKAPRGLTALHVPVPPLLAKAIGYTGRAHYVAFHWTPYGDEAEYFDGRVSGTGNWQAFLAYTQHPAVRPSLIDYDLGKSDTDANHVLILDQAILEMFIAPVQAAEKFLIRQWLPKTSALMLREEPVAKISITRKQVNQPTINSEEQYALIEAVERWLDKHLKN